MFKNIFPDKLNRLVYMTPGPERREAAAKAIKASEKAKASPAALRQEAKKLGKAIDDYAKAVKEQAVIGAPTKFRSVLKDLADAKQELIKGGSTRQNLNSVRAKIAGAVRVNNAIMRSKDPFLGLRADAPRVPRAKAKRKTERATARKETRETANMIAMAKLVDEFLATKRPITAKRKAAIQAKLRDMADKVMVGKNRNKISAGGLTIVRAAGRGTPAFRFTLRQTRRLEQGRGLVRVTEKPVYAGGSAKDFPRRRA